MSKEKRSSIVQETIRQRHSRRTLFSVGRGNTLVSRGLQCHLEVFGL